MARGILFGYQVNGVLVLDFETLDGRISKASHDTLRVLRSPLHASSTRRG
jgi:hypothetical protein